MCGILALVSFKNHEHNLSRLDEMAKIIKHRGPDDEGYALFDLKSDKYKTFFGDDTPDDVIKSKLKYSPKERYQYTSEQFTLGLAHRRLSIIDLTASGHQPMCDESGRFWITYNGEIYNFREIREELKKLGYSFFSKSDTEVILKAYIEWGKECQNKFNGMWAFVIWDNFNKSLLISRDRFGVKPLYYMFHDDFFIVSSEIKTNIPINDLLPNYREICAYIIDGPSEAHRYTFFDNVYRFPSGHSAEYFARRKPKKLLFEKYWELPSPVEEPSFSVDKLEKYSEQFYHLFDDAVRIRLYADVKVGCALSGGLDSSSIVYCAQQHYRNNTLNGKVVTFSNVYQNENEKYCDEQEYIDALVKYLKVESFREYPKAENIIEINDKGLWYEENCYEHLNVAAFNTYSICKNRGIKVALDGQGADEQLAGYSRFWYNYFHSRTKNSIEYIVSLLKSPIPYKTALYYSYFQDDFIKSRFNNRYETVRSAEDIDYRSSRNVLFPEDYLFYTINNATNKSITYSVKKMLRIMDSNSMAFSVETRQPFMDYRIVEFLNALPDKYKMYKGWTKYISRIAFDKKLPDKINWRRKKVGWLMPLKEWVSKDTRIAMDNYIINSSFTKDVLSSSHYNGFLNNLIPETLNGLPLRFYLRVYNVARHGSIFFGCK